MAALKLTHDDVDFVVDGTMFKKFDDAAQFAVHKAWSDGEATIDVLVWSRKGARWLGGDSAVKEYDEDPDASVFNRLEITVNDLGRIR
jgi:hypothetical protein